jgi:hypothetical protein
VYANADARQTKPYVIVGPVSPKRSPSHTVAGGTSVRQKRSARFAHITAASMRSVAFSRWWWLFQ